MKRFKLALIACLALAFCTTAREKLHIVFIGNSISYGAELKDRATEAPPVKVAEYINAGNAYDADISNCGVCGATTVDFLPATETLFLNATGAADRFSTLPGRIIFSVSLGTNDSACSGPLGAPVLPQQYYTNLKVIVDRLLESYPGSSVVLQYPTWYSPNTYNGAVYLDAGLKRLQSYFPYIKRLAGEYALTHPGRVHEGNPDAFGLFKDHYSEYLVPENGNAGTFYLHPNKQGAEILAKIWADSILKAVEKQ